MKKIIVILFLMLSPIVLVSCNNYKDIDDISILAFESEKGIIDQLVTNFTDTFYGVENNINIDYITDEEYAEIDVNIFNDYDIFAIKHDKLGAVCEKKIIAVNKFYSHHIISYHAGGLAKAAQLKGKVYTYPYTATTYVLYYNNTLYNSQDIMTFNDMFEKYSDSDISPLALNVNDVDLMLGFYAGANVNIFTDWDIFRLNFASEQSFLISEFIVSLKGEGVINSDYESAIELLTNEQIAAVIAPLDYAEKFEEALNDKFSVSVLPEIEVEDAETNLLVRPSLDTNMYCLHINAAHRKVALELVYYLSSFEAQTFRYENYNIAPTMHKFIELDLLAEDELLLVNLEQLQRSISIPNVSRLPLFIELFTPYIDELYNTKISDINKRIEEINGKVLSS